MNTIRWKCKNVCYLVVSLVITFLIYYNRQSLANFSLLRRLLGDTTGQPCNANLIWSTPAPNNQPSLKHSKNIPRKNKTVIGIVGPPGSGVQWMRYLIEQMTGVFTGSVDIELPENFLAEGKLSKVAGVMTYDIKKLPKYSGAIILYRKMKDTVRTRFSEMQGRGAFLEAPLQSYYGKEWRDFAIKESQEWVRRYKEYLTANVPVLILTYDELDDYNQLTAHLLRISNFLHVPIRQSIFECVVERAGDYALKPRPLRKGFQPFSLLPFGEVKKLKDYEKIIDKMITEARDKYTPQHWN